MLQRSVRGKLVQLRSLLLAALVVPAAACGVDSYLTCGAPCADGGASDATLADSGDSGGTDAGGSDAPSDVTSGDSGCKGDGGYCQKSSDCCSLSCNANNRCAASCAPQGGTCGGSSTCCVGTFCADGGCVACYQDNTPCTQDYQCCGGSCTGGYDGGTQRCGGN